MPLNNCRQQITDSEIKVEENGKKAVFINSGREAFLRTKIDGCVVKNSAACDWAVSKHGNGDIFIELKGTDVDRAVEQIVASIRYWKANGFLLGRISALIVCRQYPSNDTKVQKAATFLAKEFGAPLHVRTKSLKYQFEKVMSFDGPGGTSL